MYERLLVAVDHSGPSTRAVEAAGVLAALSGAEVWVIHLREEEVGGPTGPIPIEEQGEAAEIIEDALAQLSEHGVTAHGEVWRTLYGHAARDIVDLAREHDVSVIVMGSRGHSGLILGIVMGSTAHKVLHLGDRPVLIVH